MKKYSKNLLLISAIVFFYSCSNTDKETAAEITNSRSISTNKETYLAHIKELEQQAKGSLFFNDTLGKKLVKAYSDYAYGFPADSLSANFLFKAAEVATALGEYNPALIYYETITTKYPEYKYVVESLYLQAHIYDNFLNDDAKAKIVYERLISQYPTHKFAEDAKIQIKNLGKSDEELIKEFEEKNKNLEKSSANRHSRLRFPSFIVADNTLIG